MKIKSNILGLLVIFLIFTGIAGSAALNYWKTESNKIPATITTGDAAGEYNPEDIRGSYTFGDISSLFNIPLEDLAAAFRIPSSQDAVSFRNSSLEEVYGFLEKNGTEIGNTSVKLFVAFYTNLPLDLTDEMYVPVEAANIIRDHINLDKVRSAYLETHTIDIDALELAPTQDDAAINIATPTEEHTEVEDGVIKGKTSFQDVVDWGVSQEKIELVLGKSMPNPLILIRDFCLENGLEFSLIRGELQVLVDAVYQK